MTLKPIVHEIRIQHQVIFLDPPIEYARSSWIKQLHDWLGMSHAYLPTQSRLTFDVFFRCGMPASSDSELSLRNWIADGRCYRFRNDIHITCAWYSLNLHVSSLMFPRQLTRFPDNTLERPFALIELKVQQLKEYVAKWLQFQSLWDLEAEYVFNRLGDSLANWQQLLTEIKKARSTFDTSDTQKSFGVCVIDYEQVQARVNAKYDSWQRDILSRFGVKLGNAMKEMHASILKARNDLEHHSIEGLVGGSARRF